MLKRGTPQPGPNSLDAEQRMLAIDALERPGPTTRQALIDSLEPLTGHILHRAFNRPPAQPRSTVDLRRDFEAIIANALEQALLDFKINPSYHFGTYYSFRLRTMLPRLP
ncbi:MAG: hypothetical protein AAFX99_00820 [Myxococcota bacterium]